MAAFRQFLQCATFSRYDWHTSLRDQSPQFAMHSMFSKRMTEYYNMTCLTVESFRFLTLFEHGILHHLYMNDTLGSRNHLLHVRCSPLASKGHSSIREHKAITVKHIVSTFWFLFSGVGLSLLALMTELAFNWTAHKGLKVTQLSITRL